jgi:meso-butanediol dehydrogenase / (S,S)-butanediol dehydrogenase / diacetyl reductase
MRRFEDLVAIVTGAGSGLGRATARRLANEGARVACLDIGPSGTGAELPGDDGSTVDIRCDVRDEQSVRSAVAQVIAWAGRVDVLANVAGVAASAHTTQVSLADWERVLSVNLTGTFLVARETLPYLVQSRGAIVNVASLAGLRGWRYSAAYSASKGGVVALTRALAVEYAKAGVRVSCVCPGSIDTPLRQGLAASPLAGADPDLLAHGRALVEPPVSQPDEIAAAIAYLASPEARFATGAILQIDGAAGV